MDRVELFYSFVIGIASGIVSSVLVTAFYRAKDGEKERQLYFASVRAYLSRFANITSSEVGALRDFLGENELPTIPKWVHLSRNEIKIVISLFEDVMELQKILEQYFLEELNMLDKQHDQQKINDALELKFLPAISYAHAKLLTHSIPVQSLGNRIVKKYLKKSKEVN